MEESPFYSAISVRGYKGHRHSADLYSLTWNEKMECFSTRFAGIRVVDTVVPYTSLHLFFVNKDNYLASVQPYRGGTVQVDDKKNEQTVTNSFLPGSVYFKSDEDQGLIISSSLYRKLGYTLDENLPPTIRVLAPNYTDIPYEKTKGNGGAPFNLEELEKKTVEIPLFGVAEYVSQGEFIMSEGCYRDFDSVNARYCTNRLIDELEVVYDGDFTLAKNAVSEWVESEIGAEYLVEEPCKSNSEGKSVVRVVLDTDKDKGCDNARTSVGHLRHTFNLHFNSRERPYQLLLSESDLERRDLNINTAILYLKNNESVFQHVRELSFYLYDSFNPPLNCNLEPVETLKAFREQTKRSTELIEYFFIGVAGLLGVYVLVTFTLWVQSRMNRIGIIIACGVRVQQIMFLYVGEAVFLYLFSSIVTWLILIAFNGSDILRNLHFAYDLFGFLWILCVGLVITCVAAFLSIYYVVVKTPSFLMTYKN
jgi:hypothetical protein